MIQRHGLVGTSWPTARLQNDGLCYNGRRRGLHKTERCISAHRPHVALSRQTFDVGWGWRAPFQGVAWDLCWKATFAAAMSGMRDKGGGNKKREEAQLRGGETGCAATRI